MDTPKPSTARVVDLLRYKADHPQQRLSFQRGDAPRPALAPVTTFRPLSARELAHRQVMIRHLSATGPRHGLTIVN